MPSLRLRKLVSSCCLAPDAAPPHGTRGGLAGSGPYAPLTSYSLIKRFENVLVRVSLFLSKNWPLEYAVKKFPAYRLPPVRGMTLMVAPPVSDSPRRPTA